jgi:hypothetical protein
MFLSKVGVVAPCYSIANILSYSSAFKCRGPVIRKYSSYARDVVFECRSADRLPVVTLLSSVTSFFGGQNRYTTDYITIKPTNIENKKCDILAEDFSSTNACVQNSLDNLNTLFP